MLRRVRFGALATSGLLGRRAELAAIDEALERRSGVLAFSGEGGIGKTRLLDEVAARAAWQTSSLRWLAGGGLTLEQAARLWHIDAAVCATVLMRLVAEHFLTRTRHGAFVRLDQA